MHMACGVAKPVRKALSVKCKKYEEKSILGTKGKCHKFGAKKKCTCSLGGDFQQPSFKYTHLPPLVGVELCCSVSARKVKEYALHSTGRQPSVFVSVCICVST